MLRAHQDQQHHAAEHGGQSVRKGAALQSPRLHQTVLQLPQQQIKQQHRAIVLQCPAALVLPLGAAVQPAQAMPIQSQRHRPDQPAEFLRKKVQRVDIVIGKAQHHGQQQPQRQSRYGQPRRATAACPVVQAPGAEGEKQQQTMRLVCAGNQGAAVAARLRHAISDLQHARRQPPQTRQQKQRRRSDLL